MGKPGGLRVTPVLPGRTETQKMSEHSFLLSLRVIAILPLFPFVILSLPVGKEKNLYVGHSGKNDTPMF